MLSTDIHSYINNDKVFKLCNKKRNKMVCLLFYRKKKQIKNNKLVIPVFKHYYPVENIYFDIFFSLKIVII